MCQEEGGIEERTVHLSHGVTPRVMLFMPHLCWKRKVSTQSFIIFSSNIIECSLLILSNELNYARFGYR